LNDLVFVDTSAWYALVNRKDPDHERTRAVVEESAGLLLTSSFVLDETVTLCLRRLGHAAAVQVGTALRDPHSVQLVRATAADETQAWDLFRSRTDKQYSFTDCVSFALMRRLGVTTAAALDDDFRREGLEVVP
jgi:hypothetical protein